VSFAVSLHETIFPLYVVQFVELFACTLQNCLCKLTPKQFTLVFMNFANN